MCFAVAHMQNVCVCVCVHGFVGGELDSGQAVRTETCTSSTSLFCPCLSSVIVTAVSSSRCDRLPLRNDSDMSRGVVWNRGPNAQNTKFAPCWQRVEPRGPGYIYVYIIPCADYLL